MANGKLTLDTIQGAELDIGATNGVIVRTGTLEGIDANATSDSGVLLGILSHPDMPQLGKTTYPGTGLVFVRLFVRGFTTNGVVFAMRYETFQGIIPSAYIITDDSTMTSRTMTFDPFTKKLLEVSYTKGQPVDGGEGAGSYSAATYQVAKLDRILCPTDTLLPCREINVTRISVGHPNVKGRELFGGVNDSDWPGKPGSAELQSGGIIIAGLWAEEAPVGNPLPTGYWLLNRLKTTWTRYLNYFQTDISAISLVNMPWSQLLVARDPSTGLYVKPDASVLFAALTQAFAGYEQGLKQFDEDGFAIWGPYPTVDFKFAFGF